LSICLSEYNSFLCVSSHKQYVTYSWPMFPVSCARVHAHKSRETSAHKKTWSTHKCSFQKCFCTYFIHVIPNTWVLVKCCTKEILCAHRLWKIRGNVVLDPRLQSTLKTSNTSIVIRRTPSPVNNGFLTLNVADLRRSTRT